MSADQLANLLGAISAAPNLPGAKCAGRHDLFDESGKNEDAEVVRQRHTQAAALCHTCPALAGCRAWYDSLSRWRRPPGVVAGHKPLIIRTGRPRANSA